MKRFNVSKFFENDKYSIDAYKAIAAVMGKDGAAAGAVATLLLSDCGPVARRFEKMINTAAAIANFCINGQIATYSEALKMSKNEANKILVNN